MDTDQLIAQRASQHGDFRDNARVSRILKGIFQREAMFAMTEYQREGLDMIAFKISRILTGDPNYVDNWDDIAGYAKRVADFLRNPEPAQRT